jgi:ribosomal protein S6
MFLLDNQVVREGWAQAKARVTDTLTKHGAKVTTARRWDERKLAYTVRRRNRATFLLCYYEMGNEHIAAMRRDFDLSEAVLRYLMVTCEAIPAGETDLAAAEQATDFTVPPPPPDDAVEPQQPAPQRRRDDGEFVVPDLDALALEDDEGEDSRPRGRRPEARASTTEA